MDEAIPYSKLGEIWKKYMSERELGKKVEDALYHFFTSSFIFYLLFLSFSTSAHFERYPGVLAFTALDRMVGLGLGAFLWGRA